MAVRVRVRIRVRVIHEVWALIRLHDDAAGIGDALGIHLQRQQPALNRSLRSSFDHWRSG